MTPTADQLTATSGRLPVLRTSVRQRVTPASWAVRAGFLLDALVDRVHHDWPAAYALLHLPTGEAVHVAAHRRTVPRCAPRHERYFADRVRPFCSADPIPRRGSAGLRPIVLDVHPGDRQVRYRLDLRTAELTVEQA